jgi:hypothetical protein
MRVLIFGQRRFLLLFFASSFFFLLISLTGSFVNAGTSPHVFVMYQKS